ncbi:MAG: helical backbone metal receptor [Bacteroidota bacterium]
MPFRIISLVPSLTELICELGLRDQLVGCTKYCVHPSDLRKSEKITVIGGTKNIHFDKAEALAPDLIVANKEENTKEMVEQLQQKYKVVVTDIKTLDDAEKATRELGSIWNLEERAESIIKANRSALPLRIDQPQRALYLIWRKPWMTIGGDTYIHDMMRHFGYTNVCGGQTRYPSLTKEDMIRIDPQVVLLSSEPFPFKEKNIRELKEILPRADVRLVDGEKYSWYGARLGKIASSPS